MLTAPDEFAQAVQRAVNDFGDVLWADTADGAADLAGQARARWGMWPADVREAALVKVIALTGQLKEDTT